MTNQEILVAVKDWVEGNEELVDDFDEGGHTLYTSVVESQSLITFLEKLLHE